MNDPITTDVGAAAATSTLTPKSRPLRTWPCLLLIALIIAARYGPGLLEGGLSTYWMIGVFGPMVCCLLLLIWWLAASRAMWKERVFGVIGLVGALVLTVLLVDPTMRGPGTLYLTVPMGMIGFAIGAMLFGKRAPGMRTLVAVLLAAAGFGFSILLHSDGMTGGYVLDTHWRWSKTAEERMLATRAGGTTPAKRPEDRQTAASLSNSEWPGFRGADRAAHSRGPIISTNWTANPPKQLWKIPVGPGWSSFAVAGNFLFTQEQRGPMETVVCYAADSGKEIWSRQIEARFDDPMGGPGPRATPTLARGGLFVTGATGTLLCLNPVSGEIVWQGNLKTAAGRGVPLWGFAASPLVVGSTVIVQAGGPGNGKTGLLGFDAGTGTLQWSAADGNDSYSSPQLNTIAGEELVVMLTNDGLLLADPATGKTRLNYDWKFGNYRALQPCVVGDDTILLQTPMSFGTRAIRISKSNGQLAAQELWTTRNLKPDFTDLVTYQGFAYGNDAGILTCIDLKTGERKWKGGRYGKGQVLLLENSGLLLIAAEDGRAVLVRADPNEHTEVDSFKALEGKTWNHPVVVGDKLYLRNSQEAACYQMALAEAKQP